MMHCAILWISGSYINQTPSWFETFSETHHIIYTKPKQARPKTFKKNTSFNKSTGHFPLVFLFSLQKNTMLLQDYELRRLGELQQFL